MTGNSVKFEAPFKWIMQLLELVQKEGRLVFGAFAYVAVAAILPVTIQAYVDLAMHDNIPVRLGAMVLSNLYGIFVLAPLIGAGIRVMHSTQTGAPARPGDVLAAYGDGPFRMRMIGVGLLMVFLYTVMLAVFLALLPGKEFWFEFFKMSFTLSPGDQPDLDALPKPEASAILWLLPWTFAFMVATFVVGNAHLLAYVRVALGDRGVIASAVDAFLATLRNFFQLFVFAVVAFIALMVVSVAFGIAFAIIGLIASKLAPIAAVVLMIPVYLAMFVLAFVAIYGFYYFAWREIFADDAGESAPASAHTVAL